MGFRRALAQAAGKLTAAALHAVGRTGTVLPGKVALRIYPDFLRESSRGVRMVLVTGTNGKTTTTHLLAEMASEAGYPVITNAGGANMTAGLAAAFVQGARPHADAETRPQVAVLECDEAYLKEVAAALRPRAAVVTNLFRDQLDRWGEVTRTAALLREGLALAPEAVAVLNADDSLVAQLAEGRGAGAVRFFGLGEAFTGEHQVAAAANRSVSAPREGITCVRCGAPLAFSRTIYGHLGAFSCPACGYARPEADVEGTALLFADANGSRIRARIDGEDADVAVALPGTYNLSNALAALAACGALAIPRDAALASLARAQSSFGRMEEFACGKTPVRMILVKNPAGLDQALAYVRDSGECTRLFFGLNDKTGDGTDISWIWDADCEGFFAVHGPRLAEVAVFGTRAEDMALRLKYAGRPADLVRSASGNGGERAMYHAVDGAITASAAPVCVLANYTAMYDLRRTLGRKYRLRSMA